MARQIIILETNPAAGGEISVRAVFWYPVTPGEEVPTPSLVSAFKTPTAPEATALQSGAVIEEVKAMTFPKSFTSAQLRAAIVATYNDRLAYRNTLPNLGQFYGTAWDGTAWT